MIADIILQARQLVEAGRYTKSSLAVAAGLHANTFRDLDSEDFAPNYKTLTKLEAFLATIAVSEES